MEILAASPQLRHLSYINLENNPCRDPVDAAAGYGTDWMTNSIVPESIYLPRFGRELEARYGKIPWLNSLYHFMEFHPPNRYSF